MPIKHPHFVFISVLGIFLATSRHLGRAQQVNAPDDYIRLISSFPTDQTKLQRGAEVPFEITVEYSLQSRDNAILTVSLGEDRDPEACHTAHNELVAYKQVSIERGKGTLDLRVIWPGDTGEGSKGRVYGSGSISFLGAMWAAPLKDRFYLRSLADQYCAHF